MNKPFNIVFWGGLVGVILVLILPQRVKAVSYNDQPRVMVTSYELEHGGISRGGTSELTLTLKNMNARYSVHSVLVTCNSSSVDVFAQYGSSNQVYIEKIPPGQEQKITIPLEAADNLGTQSIQCTLNISFKDAIRGLSSTETIIHLPQKQDHLKIQRAYVPQTAVLGVKSRISITCENIKNEEIYNAVMKVKGNGKQNTSVELGRILSGDRKNQEVYINFDSLGLQNILVEFSYEDARGEKYTTATQSYQVEVFPKTKDNNEGEIAVDENESTILGRIKQAGCIIALLLCMIGSAIIVYGNKKH